MTLILFKFIQRMEMITIYLTLFIVLRFLVLMYQDRVNIFKTSNIETIFQKFTQSTGLKGQI
jgi:hypothetical protein